MFSDLKKKRESSRARCCARRLAIACFVLILTNLVSRPADAQRPRFGDSFVVPQGQVSPPVIGVQPGTVPPLVPSTGVPASAPPVLPGLQNPFPQGQPVITSPPVVVAPPVTSSPTLIQGPTFDPTVGNTTTVPSIIPSNPQPTQPPQFIYPPPGTNVQPATGPWPNNVAAWPSQTWARFQSSGVYRLLERPRWRQTWISRSGSRGLGLNETELATTLNLPNFLGSTQPLRISPGFIFHWWDGPDTAITGAELPPRTYSAYLAFDYATPWTREVGGEINFTVGVYSDFSYTTSDSVRFTGVGLGWFRISNTTTFKLGIEYLDRVRVKMLPAGGFFFYPSPNLKLDLYFPRPKLAYRLPNFSTAEVWGYIGGEYGTGSWTINRTIAGFGDQADVNDLRIFVGLEWMGPRQVTGFFEVGYVFDREIVYRSDPMNRINIDDGVMLRAGFAF